MSNPYDPLVVSPTERELLIRIDERVATINAKITKHLEDDDRVHEDHSTRLRSLESWRTGVYMLVGAITLAAGTAAALAGRF